MKLDVLDNFDKIKVCVAYKYNEEVIDYMPSNMENVETIYEEIDGWDSVVGEKIRRFTRKCKKI